MVICDLYPQVWDMAKLEQQPTSCKFVIEKSFFRATFERGVALFSWKMWMWLVTNLMLQKYYTRLSLCCSAPIVVKIEILLVKSSDCTILLPPRDSNRMQHRKISRIVRLCKLWQIFFWICGCRIFRGMASWWVHMKLSLLYIKKVFSIQ